MNNFSVPFSTGLLSVVVLFLLSLIIVTGIKCIIIYIKNFFPQKEYKPVKHHRTKKKPVLPQKETPVSRSIEINPEEIDKIYVKKTS